MAKYKANWAIQGLKDKPVELGDIIDAKPEEVADMVAQIYGGNVPITSSAVLTPIDKDGKPIAPIVKPVVVVEVPANA